MIKTSVIVSGTLRLPSGLPASHAIVRFTLSGPSITGSIVVVPNAGWRKPPAMITPLKFKIVTRGK